MAVTLRLPASLGKFFDGRSELQLEAGTVDALLAELSARNEGFGRRLLGPDGSLHRFVRLFVNGADLGSDDGVLATRLADGDVLSILMAVAGG